MNIDLVTKKLDIKSGRKLVVAIDGYSGAGKTTLLKQLAQRNKTILPVFIDDFLRTGASRRESLKKAKDKSKVVELDWNNIKKVQRLIQKFRKSSKPYTMAVYNPKTDRYDKSKTYNLSKRVLVLEGIFLFHPKLFQHTFDVRIFLDSDIKRADRRRIQRERRRWKNKYFSENHPDSFIRLFKIAYRRYVQQYKPKKLADFVIKT